MKDRREIIAENIKFYMELRGKRAIDVCDDLHYAKTSFSSWVNAVTYPRIERIEELAEYFNISVGDLVEERNEHYIDPAAQKMAQQIYENKELSLLFDAAKDASAEDLATARTMLLALKKKEKGDE